MLGAHKVHDTPWGRDWGFLSAQQQKGAACVRHPALGRWVTPRPAMCPVAPDVPGPPAAAQLPKAAEGSPSHPPEATITRTPGGSRDSPDQSHPAAPALPALAVGVMMRFSVCVIIGLTSPPHSGCTREAGRVPKAPSSS